ncbi:hypothetical protein niasHS_006669 [Heterodera schachtii]|uniref:Myb-like domain-containing protein n=1 Tax=Heterodera schachtii TaxID=97005 RepID=A0ABD2JI74_HETSC
MNSPSHVHGMAPDHSSTALIVSRRRLAFKPPNRSSNKKGITPVSSTCISADKNEHNVPLSNSAGLSLSIKTTASDFTASSSKCTTNANFVETVDKTRRMYWTFDEQAVFYEALKLHGKDFDAISKFMLKKKFNKDKDQVRNYYLNTFKVWKCKAQIEDADWENIPRDARELFVLLNGFEWRKRLKGLSFDEKKFKQLVMEGYASFRPKRRKFIVNLKTPYCPALLKYFPYDRRNCEIPQHLVVKLKPLRNMDREFVVASEQNPLLMVQINVNDKITSLFDLLNCKWLQNGTQKKTAAHVYNNNDSRNVGEIRLFIGESNQIIHDVLVGNEGNSPLLSLSKLKKDFCPIESTEMGKQSIGSVSVMRQQNEIKVSALCVKEVFEITKDKIRAGLTEDEVGNASILQLYYMLGMKKELSFSYQISGHEPRYHSWTVFKSLVARDYDELMAKGTATADFHDQPSSSSIVLEMTKTAATTSTATPNGVMTNNNNSCASSPLSVETVRPQQNRRHPPDIRNEAENGIVEQENAQFIEQLKTHCNILQPKRPKRQIKLVQDNHRKLIRVTAPPPQRQQQLINGALMSHSQHLHVPNTAIARTTVDVAMPQRQKLSDSEVLPVHRHCLYRIDHPQMVSSGTATDFSVLQPAAELRHAVNLSNNNTQQFVPTAESFSTPSSSSAPNTAIELTLMNGELSMDSSATISQFHPIVLDNSPTKTLPEDVRNAYEQMLKENSVDYCRQFEQLANLHNDGSPIKTFEEIRR